MKVLRRILLFVSGILALIDLGSVFLAVVTLGWGSIPWRLLKLAFWAALCVYLINQERIGGPAPLPDP
jgi:hypothetical protein